jgi:hypothetical protein
VRWPRPAAALPAAQRCVLGSAVHARFPLAWGVSCSLFSTHTGGRRRLVCGHDIDRLHGGCEHPITLSLAHSPWSVRALATATCSARRCGLFPVALFVAHWPPLTYSPLFLGSSAAGLCARPRRLTPRCQRSRCFPPRPAWPTWRSRDACRPEPARRCGSTGRMRLASLSSHCSLLLLFPSCFIVDPPPHPLSSHATVCSEIRAPSQTVAQRLLCVRVLFASSNPSPSHELYKTGNQRARTFDHAWGYSLILRVVGQGHGSNARGVQHLARE